MEHPQITRTGPAASQAIRIRKLDRVEATTPIPCGPDGN